MIFVTVGTHYQGFERLVKKMDEIASKINDEVIMQIGYTGYEPKNAKWFKFMEYDEILNMYRNADIVVSHAGAGTLLDALYFEKLIIVVPRLKEFDEHIDDQQIELAEALENTKKAIAVYDIGKLEEGIRKIKPFKFESTRKNENLTLFLKNHLRGIAK